MFHVEVKYKSEEKILDEKRTSSSEEKYNFNGEKRRNLPRVFVYI